MMRTCLVIASFLALASAESFLTLERDSVRMKECAMDAETCIKAKVDFQALKNSDEIELPNKFKLKRLSYTDKDDYVVATYGYENPHGANGYLLFSKDLSWASGSILDDVSLKRFALAPCDDHVGCHIWSEVKPNVEKGISSINIPSIRGFDTVDTERLLQLGQTDNTTVVNVTITFMVTTEAQANLGDTLFPFIYDTIEGMRFTMKHSQIPINIQLRCVEMMTTGLADYGHNLNNMMNGLYHRKDLQKYADFCFCLTVNLGTPYAYVPGRLGRKITFAIVDPHKGSGDYLCNYIMSTIIGCMANEEAETNSRFPYGHAFLIRPPVESGLRTLLARGASGYGQAISYFSNPNVNYKGMIIGTEEKNNNARVFTEQRFIMAAVGDEGGSCSTPLPVSTPKPITCKDYYVKDGFCDDSNNYSECEFDGGDCCTDTNNNPTYKDYCDDCVCNAS